MKRLLIHTPVGLMNVLAFWLGVQQFKYFGGIWNEDLANTYWPRVEVS